MGVSKNRKQFIALAFSGFFILTGTYNAIIINSESHISGSDYSFVKRLDEVYGVTTPGRLAASVQWQKLEMRQPAPVRIAPVKKEIAEVKQAEVTAAEEAVPQAAVQEDLELRLVEVVNPKKWQKGLTEGQFMGELLTNNGIIEALNVDLPNGEGVSVSFSEMTGNVFEYDFNGQMYSGMMYQVDQHSYMVTLTNGPLEGTRLRFSGSSPEAEQVYAQEYLADHNIEAGNFGEEVVQAEVAQADADTALEGSENYDQQMQAEEASYNLEQQAL